MNLSEKYKKLYAKIPSSKCRKGCFRCCTNMVQYTPEEEKAMGGYAFDGICSHLKDGKCTVYEVRPFVCRLYGVSTMLQCEECSPEKLLNETETNELVHTYVEFMNKENNNENDSPKRSHHEIKK